MLTVLIFYFCQARFPFLDEDVIRTLLDIPLWEVANLDQPSGTGDKKILREVGNYLFSDLMFNSCADMDIVVAS